MKPFHAALICGLFGTILVIHGIVGFVTGHFNLGKHGIIFSVDGGYAYVASTLCCMLGLTLGILCLKKIRQGLNEPPYRIDYP